jgi:hypothetical protein
MVNSLINRVFRFSSLFLCFILVRKAPRDPVIPLPIIHPLQSLFSPKLQLTQEMLIFTLVSDFALSYFFAVMAKLILDCSRSCCVKFEADLESRSRCDGAEESILVCGQFLVLSQTQLPYGFPLTYI